MKTERQIIGKIGEDLVCEYYIGLHHIIKDRNYLRKWGEIDVITLKDQKIYFIEVKTVCRSYICNTSNQVEGYKAEQNVHLHKTKRLKRTIQTYLLGMRNKREVDWQFDVMIVTLNKEDMELMKMERMEDVIL